MTSVPALARTLRTTEYFTLAFGAMVGVGWLIVIDDWLGRGGPVGAMLGFLIGGIALAPIAWVYGRYARDVQDAGSELAYASAVFPPAVGFGAAWLMTLAYLIVCPWEAVAIGKIVAYLVPAVESGELYRIAGRPVHAPALALGLGATLVVSLLNYRGIRLSARFQNTTTFALLGLFALFSAMGLARGSAPNLAPPFSRAGPTPLAGAVVSIVLVLQVVPYFLTGFESVPKASEEARRDLDPRSFARAIFAGLACGVAFYVVVIGVVAGLEPWQALVEERFPTAAAFERAFRSPVAARLIIAAALVSLFKVFNANFLTASRLVFALGRRALIPARLGRIDPRFQSPAAAVVFCGVATAAGALLGDAILIPVTEVGSLASAVGWSITCLAFLRRSGKESGAARAVAALGAAVALALVAIKLVPRVPGSFGPWEYVALGSWVVVGIVLRLLSLRGRPYEQTPS